MAPTEWSPARLTVLVGAVAELYQGDLDFGRVALERLAARDLGPAVVVEELSYGAIAVAQRLAELRPSALVLVGAAARGRTPGTLERRRLRPAAMDPGDVRQAVLEAGTGYVSIDLLVEVCTGLWSLPARTVAIEVEPVNTVISEQLSADAQAALEPALDQVEAEVLRMPLLELADRLRSEPSDGGSGRTAAATAVDRLLAELARVDEDGRWGDTLALGDSLRRQIGSDSGGARPRHEGASALLDELERLQRLAGARLSEDCADSRSRSASSRSPRW